MGRIVVAEEKIFPELVRFGKTEGYIPGLIIGQCSGQKDFIIHLAKTPLPTEKSNKSGNDVSGDCRKIQKKSLEKLSEIQESWLVDHAKQVTRMLPGGIWVLGLFVTGPGDVFTEPAAQSKLGALLRALTKALEQNPSLHGNSPSTERLLLQLVAGTNKFVCKSYDVSTSVSQFRATDCKFTSGLRWHQLDTHYDFDLHSPLLITEQQLSTLPLKAHLQKILDIVSSEVKKALCAIDGEVKNGDDTIEAVDTSKGSKADRKSQETKTLRVDMFVPDVSNQSEFTISSIVGEMKSTGVLASRVFVHQKATYAEAFNAVKEDIIRSFAARIEMHCDSLVEEEIGSPDEMMVVHEPPRRVLIPLPYSKVALSDYLFPGEGPSEALLSIADLIGVQVSEAAICKDFEGQPDQSDLYNLTTSVDPPNLEESSSSSQNHSMLLISSIAAAFLVLVVSLFIQFYFK